MLTKVVPLGLQWSRATKEMLKEREGRCNCYHWAITMSTYYRSQALHYCDTNWRFHTFYSIQINDNSTVGRWNCTVTSDVRAVKSAKEARGGVCKVLTSGNSLKFGFSRESSVWLTVHKLGQTETQRPGDWTELSALSRLSWLGLSCGNPQSSTS